MILKFTYEKIGIPLGWCSFGIDAVPTSILKINSQTVMFIYKDIRIMLSEYLLIMQIIEMKQIKISDIAVWKHSIEIVMISKNSEFTLLVTVKGIRSFQTVAPIFDNGLLIGTP